MNTIVSAESNPIYLIAFCAVAFLFILFTILNFTWLKNKQFKFSKKRIQIILSIFFLVLTGYIYSLFMSYENTVVSQTVALVEKNQEVKDVQILDNSRNIVCKPSFTGSVNAASWKQGKQQKLGVLIGTKKDNGCQFVLKSV